MGRYITDDTIWHGLAAQNPDGFPEPVFCAYFGLTTSLSPDAIPSADQIRITPSLRSQRGSVWTKTPVNFEHWEAEVAFRISGRGRTGADGLVHLKKKKKIH